MANQNKPRQRREFRLTEEFFIGLTGIRWERSDYIAAGGMSYIYDVNKIPADGIPYIVKLNTPMREIRFAYNLCTVDKLEEAAKHYKRSINLAEFIDGGPIKKRKVFFMIMKKRIAEFITEKIVPDEYFTTLVRQLLDCLEYMHDNNYVHNDIKSENILYEDGKFFLTDYGVVSNWKGVDVSKAFCGTRAYIGLDMHESRGGSPRNDLDNLLLCMLEWSGIRLPWMGSKKDPQDLDWILDRKTEFFSNPKSLLDTCPSKFKRDIMLKFIQQNSTVAFTEKPNYNLLRDLLYTGYAPCTICTRLTNKEEIKVALKKILHFLDHENHSVISRKSDQGFKAIIKESNLVKEMLCQNSALGVKANPCPKCEKWEHLRSQIYTSTAKKDKAAISALKYLNLWD